MITMRLSSPTGCGLRQRIVVPAVEAELLAGRSVLILTATIEMQKQFERLFVKMDYQPCVSTAHKVLNQTLQTSKATLIIIDQLPVVIFERVIKQLVAQKPEVEFWAINSPSVW